MTLSCYCHLVPKGKRCLNCYLNWKAAGGFVRPNNLTRRCDCGTVIRNEDYDQCYHCRHATVKTA